MNNIDRLSIKNQRIILWFGVAFPVGYALGWALIAGFFPPPAPYLSAEEIATLYREEGIAIRVGMMICLVVNCFCVPWAVAIWMQMLRLEEGRVPVWSTVQLTIGALNVVFFMVPTCLWMTTAFVAQFRPEISPETLRIMNDFAWILWFVTYAPTSIQCWCMGYMGIKDERKTPIFPRWWCYMQFWVGLCYVPAGVIPFFVQGPFSWVGLIGLWLPVGVYFLWFPLTAWGLFKAIRHEENEKSQIQPTYPNMKPAHA